MMETARPGWLLLLLVLVAGCGAPWMMVWHVALGAVPAQRGVETLWLGQGGERVNLLWRDEAGQARIEQFDLRGYAWGSLTVASSHWTGAYGIHPGDDSVLLLERAGDSADGYALLRQQLDGGAHRVPVRFPPLSEGQTLQIDRIVAVTAQDQLAIDARVLDRSRQPVERRLMSLATTGEMLGQYSAPAQTSSRFLKIADGYLWVEPCAHAAAGQCVMRFVALDERLQVEREHDVVLADVGLDPVLLPGESLFPTTTGTYALLEADDLAAFMLCRFDQAWRQQWCERVGEAQPFGIGIHALDAASVRAAVDSGEDLYLSFVVENTRSGIRGAYHPQSMVDGRDASESRIELSGTRARTVHLLKYARDGRRLTAVKHTSFKQQGSLMLAQGYDMQFTPTHTSPGICEVSQTVVAPAGGLLSVSRFCRGDETGSEWRLARWQ